jgi:hypothetical protein
MGHEDMRLEEAVETHASAPRETFQPAAVIAVGVSTDARIAALALRAAPMRVGRFWIYQTTFVHDAFAFRFLVFPSPRRRFLRLSCA